jgi:aryl-alcohol dehydrogenase-like predicted oxidoreductase
MQTRTIAGQQVSLVGLGCNNFGMRIDEDQSRLVVHAALDAGITFFDTADMYGTTKSEDFLGRILAGKWDDVVIATKFGGPVQGEGSGGGSRKWAQQAVDDSLRRLGVDVIDLYQYHYPDPNVPLEETMGAMHEMVIAGKVRAIGHSNFNGNQIDQVTALAEQNGWTRYVTAQNNFSVIQRDGIVDDVLPACERNHVGLLPWYPLGAGMLTGKYRRGEPAPDGTRLATAPEERRVLVMNDTMFDRVERLEKWAADRGHTILELAFAWLAAIPSIPSIIAGATRPEQVKANVAAVEWTLTPAEWDEVAALGR